MITVGSEAYTRIVMFATLITLFVSLYLLSKKVQRFRSVLYFLSSFCGLLFAFTYIPFFIFYFFDRTPFWTRLLVFMLSIVAWLFFPVLRRKSSVCRSCVFVFLCSVLEGVSINIVWHNLFWLPLLSPPVCLWHHFMDRACVRSNTATTGVCLQQVIMIHEILEPHS